GGLVFGANRREAPARERVAAKVAPATPEPQVTSNEESTVADVSDALEEKKKEAEKTPAVRATPPTEGKAGRAGGPPPPAGQPTVRNLTAPRKAAIVEIDRNAVVQTGPGIPHWTWLEIPLRWSGPVQQGQEVRLWLLSPAENVLLGLLRVGLLAALAWLLLVRSGGVRLPPLRAPAATAASVLCLLLLGGTARAEEEPTDERLEQLREKLLQAPRCAPVCASAGRALLEGDPAGLRPRLGLQAAGLVAFPPPRGGRGGRPRQVGREGQA